MKAPFPYFGGKRRAAPTIWSVLGDPGGYVEPFAGSAAALLARPRHTGRRVETINDADGWLINTWRAIQLSPEAVADHAAGPVSEIDYHARLAWLQDRRDGLVSWLEGDPEAHDAKAAAWWLYVMACGIGNPWDAGPWSVVDGRLVKSAGRGINRALPHLGDAGRGINRALPHLGNAGRGINRAPDHLSDYMTNLAHRLQHVRITCGHWARVTKPSVIRAKTGGDGSIGVLLDPPYVTSGDLYAANHGHRTIAEDVRAWCLTAPDDLRIVLCGYETEHDDLLAAGWRKIAGKSGGGAGYNTSPAAGRRERLWISPACLDEPEPDLFGESDL